MDKKMICYLCPKTTPGCLPEKILQAAEKGSLEEVKQWLKKGGNVNEGNHKGQMLLTAACFHGQLEVVKELLQHHDLHLNIGCQQVPPSVIQAAIRGHSDIIQLLLNSTLKCRVNVNLVYGHASRSISHALINNHWRVVDLLLEHQVYVSVKDATFCMLKASAAGKWEIVLDLLQRDHSYEHANLTEILQRAYVHKEWEVMGEVFRKIVTFNNDISLSPIYKMLENKDWNSLEFVLKYVEDTVSINSALTEAILAKRKSDAVAMLEKEKDKKEVLNAALLVACIGGTSEELAAVLVCQTCYSRQVLNYSLIFAAIFNRLEVLPLLFEKNKLSCQTIARARKVANDFKHEDSIVFLKEAFLKTTKDIMRKELNDMHNPKDMITMCESFLLHKEITKHCNQVDD